MAENKKQIITKTMAKLKSDFEQWRTIYQNLADYIAPNSYVPALFQTKQKGHTARRNNVKVLNPVASDYLGKLVSGLMSNKTPAAKPWFQLGTNRSSESQSSDVKQYLYTCTERMRIAFQLSNFYSITAMVYTNVVLYGNSPMIIEKDYQNIFNVTLFPVGSYLLIRDKNGNVNGIYRRFTKTVRQLVEDFGKKDESGNILWDNFSITVQNYYKNNNLENEIEICHVIYPNPDYEPKLGLSKYKKYASLYYEMTADSSIDNNGFLRESGYDRFPVVVPSWSSNSESVYCDNCPGINALLLVKQLQVLEKRLAQAIEKKINPPLMAPDSLRHSKISTVPGDVTYLSSNESGAFRPIYDINSFQINEVEAKIQKVESDIAKFFYADIFSAFLSDDRSNITAAEVYERSSEKLALVAPVSQNLDKTWLDPTIDIVFDILNELNLLPKPPEELQGQDLQIEYISTMAQAQKSLGMNSINQFVGNVGQIATIMPEVIDNLDGDKIIEILADLSSSRPDILRNQDEVKQIRDNRSQQQARQQQMVDAQQQAITARNLAGAKMGEDNALTKITEGLQQAA